MKNKRNILWGTALVIVGVIFALKSLDILNFSLFFNGWWTLFIIVPCAIGLFTERDKTGNLIGIAIGLALLLAFQDVIRFQILWKLIVPAIFVVFGLKLIFGNKAAKAIAGLQDHSLTGQRVSCVTFSGNDMIVNGEVFEGAELTAVFGGINCDLRNAIIEKDCVIKVSAIFGGIDIFVSDKVNVQTNSTSIFGGMSNKTPPRKDVPTIYVSGSCLFGGVDIK